MEYRFRENDVDFQESLTKLSPSFQQGSTEIEFLYRRYTVLHYFLLFENGCHFLGAFSPKTETILYNKIYKAG